jgi:hypothetical protein
MRARKHKQISSLTLLLMVAILFVVSFFVYLPRAISDTATPINGYAWSDNIGWISFNCTNTASCGTFNYGLSIAGDGTVSGYAWSDNIGWVSANSVDVAGCPSAPCTPALSATTGAMTGWLRAIANGGGWDGWISLSGAGYGPILASNGTFSGYAWGSDVVGWTSFAYATSSYTPCVPNSNVCLDATTLRHYNADCTYTDAVCQFAAYGYGCSGNACLVPPNPGPGTVTDGIIATPRLVRAGNTVQISWDVVNADPASCTVTGSNGDFWSGLASATVTSGIINSQTTYLLHCEGSAVDILTYDAQTTVSIVPTFKEK